MKEELQEHGKVLNTSNGFVEIELLENDNCDDCSAKLFCNPQKDKSKTLKIENTDNLKKGDQVTITILGKSLLNASLNLYLYPLLILIATIFIGTEIFKDTNAPEIYSFLLGIILISIYYLGFFQISKKFGDRKPNIFVTREN